MDSLLHFDGELPALQAALDMAYGEASITQSEPDPNNNNSFPPTIIESIPIKEDKYSLRPRSVRRVTELLQPQKTQQQIKYNQTNLPHSLQPPNQPSKAKPTKPKQKSAPLSKYRRKTANARERNRMREINQAFETLRRVIPQMQAAAAASTVATTSAQAAANEKLTKITTLRLAMRYISNLSAKLQQDNGGADMFLTDYSGAFSDCSDLDCLLLESDGESLPLSDHSLSLTSPDFPDTSLSPVDFGDPNTLSPFLQSDFADHSLECEDDFSEFLLT